MVTSLLVFLIDALGFSLLNEETMPFLFRIAGGRPYRLRPVLGYSMGIHLSIWTGVSQNAHGRWSEYVYTDRPNRTHLSTLCRLFPDTYSGDFLISGINYAFTHITGKTAFLPGLPRELMPFFKKCEYYKPGGFSQVPTLFDIASANGSRYSYWEMHRPSFDKMLGFDFDRPLSVIFIDRIDNVGHRNALDSSVMRQNLLRLDSFIQDVVTRWRRRHQDGHIVILSDHGLTPIRKRLDLKSELGRLSWRIGRDYVAFYDSTILRLWFRSADVKEGVLSHLSCIEDGKVLSSDDLQKYRIAFGKDQRSFGESIFLANPGVYIFPNSFHCVLPDWIKNMHGYDPDHSDSHGVFLYEGPCRTTERPVVDVVDVLPTMLDVLGLPRPSSCEGKSLVET